MWAHADKITQKQCGLKSIICGVLEWIQLQDILCCDQRFKASFKTVLVWLIWSTTNELLYKSNIFFPKSEVKVSIQEQIILFTAVIPLSAIWWQLRRLRSLTSETGAFAKSVISQSGQNQYIRGLLSRQLKMCQYGATESASLRVNPIANEQECNSHGSLL